MKRFVVFGGDRHYPKGGWQDWLIDFSDRASAIGWAKGYVAGESLRWAHVVDMVEGSFVWNSEQ